MRHARVASIIPYMQSFCLGTRVKPPAMLGMGKVSAKLRMKLTESQRFSLTIVALASVSLTVSLSSTSMSNAVPVITSQFHGTDVQAFWSGTANLLCSAVFQPAFAVFSYIFGRKPLVIR
jgi:hypothetical protein